MAYINKKDFSIREFVLMNKFIPNDDYFECDDLIAPAIALLNKKGYKTTFCCSGHPYPYIDSVLCDTLEITENYDVLEIKLAEEVKDKLINEFGYTKDEVNNAPYLSLCDLYYIVYTNNYSSKLYVSFEDNYEFPDLPEIFCLDETDEFTTIRQKYTMDKNYNAIPDALETFEGMELVFDTNRIFYNYVKGLKSLV